MQNLNANTIASLQDLVRGLHDSIEYHEEAAGKIEDSQLKQELLAISTSRKEVCETIGGFISATSETPVDDGTFLGSLRKIWMSFRASLNSGDPTVVLIEAERAEDVIVNRFKEILPEIAGTPVNDSLLKCFELTKAGHDRVLALRNLYQQS